MFFKEHGFFFIVDYIYLLLPTSYLLLFTCFIAFHVSAAGPKVSPVSSSPSTMTCRGR